MGSILNNLTAQGALRRLYASQVGMQTTLDRLTSGKRINRASDDAAGLGIASHIGADIRVGSQARRNAHVGISYLQVADGALEEATALLLRGQELAEQSRTGTVNDVNRENLDMEFQNILTTLIDLGQSTQFNGASVFTTNSVSISVGGFTPVSVTVGTISDTHSAFGLHASGHGSGSNHTLRTSDEATVAATAMGEALQSLSHLRAILGAAMEELGSISNSLGIQVESLTSAHAQIRDANVADEVVNLTKFQILNQAGTNALDQSNQSHQQMLTLLR